MVTASSVAPAPSSAAAVRLEVARFHLLRRLRRRQRLRMRGHQVRLPRLRRRWKVLLWRRRLNKQLLLLKMLLLLLQCLLLMRQMLVDVGHVLLAVSRQCTHLKVQSLRFRPKNIQTKIHVGLLSPSPLHPDTVNRP